MLKRLFAKTRLNSLSAATYYFHKIKTVYGDNMVHEGCPDCAYNRTANNFITDLLQKDYVILDNIAIPSSEVRSMEAVESYQIIVHAGDFFESKQLRYIMPKEELETLDEEYKWFQMEFAGAVGGQPNIKLFQHGDKHHLRQERIKKTISIIR